MAKQGTLGPLGGVYFLKIRVEIRVGALAGQRPF